MAKKKPQDSAPNVPPTFSDHVIDRVVGMVVMMRSRAAVQRELVESEDRDALGLEPAQAVAAIDEALRRIRLAAAFDFDYELGAQRTRLAELFTERDNTRCGLAIAKEIAKLLDLYPKKGAAGDGDVEGDSEALAELAAAREHLAPLVNAGPDDALDDIARRIVALFVTQSPAAPVAKRKGKR